MVAPEQANLGGGQSSPRHDNPLEFRQDRWPVYPKNRIDLVLLGSVLKAGLCCTGLDRATTCPYSLQSALQKGLAIGRNSSGTAVNPGRRGALRSCPAGSSAEGAFGSAAAGRRLPNGGSKCRNLPRSEL